LFRACGGPTSGTLLFGGSALDHAIDLAPTSTLKHKARYDPHEKSAYRADTIAESVRSDWHPDNALQKGDGMQNNPIQHLVQAHKERRRLNEELAGALRDQVIENICNTYLI
jgi:hypothetical protein